MAKLDPIEGAARTFNTFLLAHFRDFHRKLPIDDYNGEAMLSKMLVRFGKLQDFVDQATGDHTYTDQDVADAKEELEAIATIAMAFWVLLFDH